MKTKLVLAALTAVASMVVGAGAQAAVWDFSYAASNGDLTGVINGALQADGDTVLVSSIHGVEFNGVRGAHLTDLTNFELFFALPGAPPPTVTLDGTNMEIGDCTPGCSKDGFFIDTSIISTIIFGGPAFLSGPTYGADTEGYNPANWSMTAGVPEPDAWIMLLAGIGGIGAALRRSRKSPETFAAA